MRKLSILLALLLILTLAVPAAAKAKERVGTRIDLFSPSPSTFAENEPFHIVHGWLVDTDNPPIGRFEFTLDVDGVFIRESFVERTVDPNDGLPTFILLWVFNFPEGMTGTHTFTGHFLGPCQPLVDAGLYPGPCKAPADQVEALAVPHTVEFVP